MRVAPPQSKMVSVFTMNNVQVMYSKAAIATFTERTRMKGMKLYGDYVIEETIAISNKDKDDMEFAKRLRSDMPSPKAFASMMRVKPKVLTRHEKMLGDKDHLQKVAIEKRSMWNEVAELRALLLKQERQMTLAQPSSNANFIS